MRRSLVFISVTCLVLTACGGSRSNSKPEGQAAQTQAAKPSTLPANRKPDARAKDIDMAPGATLLRYKGTLDANKDAEFVVGGEEGWVFMAHALTPEQDLDIGVYRADTGERITDEQPANPAFFMAHLPATLGYLVLVRGSNTSTPYTLEIEVPLKLFFDKATRTVKVTNSAAAGGEIEYLAPKSAVVTAELTSAAKDSYLTVHALDGRKLLLAEANSRKFVGGAGKPNEEVVIHFNQGATAGDFSLQVKEQ